MSEKKQVLYDLRTSYTGPFVVEEFYAEVDSWIKEKGFTKEYKRKTESVTKDGKNIRYIIEIHSHLNDLYYGVVVLDVLMDKVREAIIKKGGKKLRLHNGDALITIEGFLESHIHGSFWQVKPMFYFWRTLIDKYIYNFWSDKWDGTVNSQGRELLKRIQAFFSTQKYKYE